jgi:hypothetical protein
LINIIQDLIEIAKSGVLDLRKSLEKVREKMTDPPNCSQEKEEDKKEI